MNKKTNSLDVLVVGAGPAGLQLGYFLEKTSINYLILEGGSSAGETFKMFPVHRKLISINKKFTGSNDPEFNMRHDWNSLICDEGSISFTSYDDEYFPDADSLVTYMGDYANKFSLKINYDTRVSLVRKTAEDTYVVVDAKGNEYYAKHIVIATGFKKPNIPNIPGIEHSINYVDIDLDTKMYENKRVLVLGKGNSGFETADHLIASAALIHVASPNPIKMAWKTHYVGHLRAVNNNLLDTYQLKSQNAVLDAEILNIEKISNGQLDVTVKYGHAEGEIEVLRYDYLIVCAGFKLDRSIFDSSSMPDTVYNDKFPLITPQFESSNNKNMFFAGTITHSLDYKKATSGFIHGFRYNCRFLFNILNQRVSGVAYPSHNLRCKAEEVVQLMLDRVNRAAGLWQQAAFMTDVFILEHDKVVHLHEMPKPYVIETFQLAEYFTLNLEFGDPIEGDPFNVERIHRANTENSVRSQFLHPVIRYYRGGNLVSRHDVIEDLEANWVEPEHVNPLLRYIQGSLSSKLNCEGAELEASMPSM